MCGRVGIECGLKILVNDEVFGEAAVKGALDSMKELKNVQSS